MKKWSKTEISIALTLILIFGLSFAMIVVERYFSLDEVSATIFGLSGIYMHGSFFSYTELDSECDSSHFLANYCSDLSDLKDAGRALQIILVADVLVLLIFVLVIIAVRILLKKIISHLEERQELRRSYVSLTKWVILCRYVVFLHPFLLILGVLYWGSESGITRLDGTVKKETGLVLAFIHCLVSFVFSAVYAYYISSSKRRNILLMLKRQMERQRGHKQSQSKIELIEVDLNF